MVPCLHPEGWLGDALQRRLMKVKGGTLTNSIFVCTQIQKRVIPLNQAQFADGIRGVVCQVWTTGSLVLGKFRLFWVDFGHFQYGVISF